MAVYRSTYNPDRLDDGIAMTQKVNFLTGCKRQADGSWNIGRPVACAIDKPH